jgi:pimeloyl-ACP methyl ester carboxylesterase
VSTAVMDHFGVKRAHVIGYSMGGIVAQQLAHDAPERVQRMVLLATTPGRGSFHGNARAMMNLFTPVRYLSPRLYAKTIGSLVGGRARRDAAFVAEQGLVRLKHPPTWRGYLWQLFSIMRWSAFPILRKVPQEVLVLAGDDDPLVPVVNAMMLTHMLPNGRLRVIHDEGHLMAMDPNSLIHPAIREFLTAESLGAAQVWQSASKVDAKEIKIALAKAEGLPLAWAADTRLRRRWLRPATRARSR